MPDDLAVRLDQPGGLLGVGEVGPGAGLAVSFGEERREVFRRVEATERLGERRPADRGQRGGVAWAGATDNRRHGGGGGGGLSV